MGSSAAELCTQKRQMSGTILAHRFPTTPSTGLNSGSLDTSFSLFKPQAWSDLKARRGCGEIAFPVLAPTSGRDRVTHRTHLSQTPTKFDLVALNHYAKAAEFLESGRIGASWGKIHFSAIFLPQWCQDSQWRAHCAPTSHFLAQPDCFQHMYMLCMAGSGNGVSKGADELVGHVRGGPVVGRTC